MNTSLRSTVLLLSIIICLSADNDDDDGTTTTYRIQCDDFTRPNTTCYGICDFPRGPCHCVRKDLDNGCPQRPRTGYTAKVIDTLRSQTPLNPFDPLECNPFNNAVGCNTNPPLPAGFGPVIPGRDGPVCAITYDGITPKLLRTNGCIKLKDCPANYTMESYSTIFEARRNGAFVTHFGTCGLCSTTQDLATYMTVPLLEPVATNCIVRFLELPQPPDPTSPPPAPSEAQVLSMINCMQDVGLTLQCAQMWIWNGLHVFENCGDLCISLLTDPRPPNTGDECKLDPCLECDRVFALPTFSKFAGRRRGRSGILSGTVRNCSEVARIRQGPCYSVVWKKDFVA